MTRHIALLRAINLGASRRVPMADLRRLLEELGYDGVRTHLQSGNVLFDAGEPADLLRERLEGQIGERFGFEVPVIVRTREELAEVVRADPFADVATDPRRYQVSFLAGEPEPAAIAAIAAVDIRPERFVQIGREIYAWHPEGVQRSVLARMLSGERLGVAATARNWRTVTDLLALADA